LGLYTNYCRIRLRRAIKQRLFITCLLLFDLTRTSGATRADHCTTSDVPLALRSCGCGIVAYCGTLRHVAALHPVYTPLNLPLIHAGRIWQYLRRSPCSEWNSRISTSVICACVTISELIRLQLTGHVMDVWHTHVHVRYMLSPVHLWSVCNVRAPYSIG